MVKSQQNQCSPNSGLNLAMHVNYLLSFYKFYMDFALNFLRCSRVYRKGSWSTLSETLEWSLLHVCQHIWLKEGPVLLQEQNQEEDQTMRRGDRKRACWLQKYAHYTCWIKAEYFNTYKKSSSSVGEKALLHFPHPFNFLFHAIPSRNRDGPN